MNLLRILLDSRFCWLCRNWLYTLCTRCSSSVPGSTPPLWQCIIRSLKILYIKLFMINIIRHLSLQR